MRPIVVAEVIRRIIGKSVTKVAKQDIVDASGSLQDCASLASGNEAAIHAMHSIFKADDTKVWRHEKIPNKWKKGLIFKLPKKGNVNDVRTGEE